jgi:hypothetical protein
MTTPIQPAPSGSSSPGNPSITPPAHTQGSRPQQGGTQTPGKRDDTKTTKLTATDTTGEMESSGGGHKSAAYSVDPPKTNVRGNAPIAPGATVPVESDDDSPDHLGSSKGDSSDRRDLSKGNSPDRRDSSKGDAKNDGNSADRSGTKQQGC